MNNPGDYTEANAWQYTWTPSQYDWQGYTDLLGGKPAFTRQLDTFFELTGDGDNKHLGQEGIIGQYAHGNEPSHHIAYLYAFSDNPTKGRELITQIYQQFYSDQPDGITGNDDCGQMSAWYIFTTLGFYPVHPANAEFVLGLPQVQKAVVHLDQDNTFTVTKSEGSDGSISINGQAAGKTIDYATIMKGGSLEF